ncbi:MAG: hypothetical protein KDA68_16825 [Planctomycetaceae bacterium]|nr:hypothetical protein [Planctomycetaceae bacterium]
MAKTWVESISAFHRAPVFKQVAIVLTPYAFYTALVYLLDRFVIGEWLSIQSNFHALLGTVLGLLLVFRTNTAYDRWWEGRKLWGQLVNDSRNLAIKIQSCVRAPEVERQLLGVKLISFAYALKDHLRGNVRLNELPGFTNEIDQPQHVPAYVSRSLYEQFEKWRTQDQLDGFEMLFLDRHAAALMDICGACERIRKTPIAASYRWFMRQLVGIYLLTLPWALVDDFQIWVIPSVTLIGYFMIGIELIAEDIEEPFGTGADDLKLDDLCQGIENSVSDILKRHRQET